ncbi:MAG: hypothetical protein AAFX05_12805 [Planctomycetota bacterium]
MTGRDKTIQSVCAILIVLSLGVSGALSMQISSEAGRAQLVYTDQATEGDPPSVALGIAMGAFRGLFVNYLWIRANDLKEAGKFHEAIELSAAITKLQPRFPRVWAFHAWNMAYNISVATKTAEERWQWVDAGVTLLRDEGIPKNPNDVLLHKELAWIFVHKIQGFTDDANQYYKRRIAEEWSYILGQPPRLDSDTAIATSQMIEWFSIVADAPSALEDVIQREEEDRRAELDDPNAVVESRVEQLVQRIGDEARMELDFDLLRLVTLHRRATEAWYAQAGMLQLNESRQNQVLSGLLDDETYADAWERLLPHVRKRVLIDEYHMEPWRMRQYMETYGPLDFRHPASHSLYWAARGVEEGLERKSTTSSNTINTDRLVFHSIQELWRTGTIYYDVLTDEYLTLVDLHFTDTYENTYDELVGRAGISEDPERTYRLYSAGYENFLKDVVRVYYRLGRKDLAQQYRERYMNWPGRNTNDPREWENDRLLNLDEWVRHLTYPDEFDNRLSIPYVATTEVYSSLTEAYVRGLLGNDPEAFKGLMTYARQAHQYYFQEQGTQTLVDADRDRMEYMSDNFMEVAATVFIRLIDSGSIQPLQGSRIYEGAPLLLRQFIYDDLRSVMTGRGMAEEMFTTLFTEPADMAAHRARFPKRDQRLEQREDLQETLEQR